MEKNQAIYKINSLWIRHYTTSEGENKHETDKKMKVPKFGHYQN